MVLTMSDREKLIESIKAGFGPIKSYEVIQIKLSDAETIADHLISKGVTVHKWIPVSERLPSSEDEIQFSIYDDPAVLAVFKFDDRPRIWCIDVIRRNPEKFTHWMPLPALDQSESRIC